MSSNRELRLEKRLLQFNQLPFAFGEISDPTYTVAFKGESQPYTNATHGSYYPTLGESGILSSGTFRATFSIDFKKLACEDKIRYARFVRRELAKSGKLWAVQNGVELMWTNARITDISEGVDDPSKKDLFNFAVTFELIEGVWHLAKRTRTFLCDYCPNRFEDFDTQYCNDTYDYYGVCDETGNSSCLPCEFNDYSPPKYEGCNWKPLCYFPLFNERISRDINGQEVVVPSIYDMFGVSCSNQTYIRYDCDLEKAWFCYDGSWGRKWRLDTSKANNATMVTFCSRTDLPTTGVRVRLVGEYVNPTITINGDTVTIPSVDGVIYNGILTIGFGNKVWWTRDKREPFKNAVDITYRVQRSNTPMFELQAGANSVTITGAKFGSNSYFYIEEKALSF